MVKRAPSRLKLRSAKGASRLFDIAIDNIIRPSDG
jgi:hypothetical protein